MADQMVQRLRPPPPEPDGEIVQAVRDGDDLRIRALPERLAQQADTGALLLLRTRLNEDLFPGARPGPGRE
ncbi:hypothetical protein ACWDZ4_13500 [Streptomyces sp. NPDC003016]